MSEQESRPGKVVRVLIYACAAVTVLVVIATVVVSRLPAPTP
jgi:preprotein translocase subunit Sec61beta